MKIDFLHPIYLILLIPAFFSIVWWIKHQKRVFGLRRFWIAGIRSLIFILLILTLAGIQILSPVDHQTIIFVADRSDSLRDDQQIHAFIQETVKNKKASDQYAIISIGHNSKVEQPMSINQEVPYFTTELNQKATNIADGLRLATGLLNQEEQGKIVLLTDGLETHGSAIEESQFIKELGIKIDGVFINQPVEDEVYISSFRLPDQLQLNQEMEAIVQVNSTTATSGILRFYEGNKEVDQQRVRIEKGRNQFLFHQKMEEEGFHRYRIELTADNDTILVNNQVHGFVQVKGSPKILVIEGHQDAAYNLIEVLKAGKVAVDVRKPDLLPKELEDYKQYTTIILADTEATQVSDADMERIRTSVRDLGVGFIMTGGEDSFGMGGWFKTPIEEALPVYMDLKGKEEIPSLGLVLVIDKSGSMSSGPQGINNMELAKEAAIRATEMLTEQDQIGIIAFDGSPWVVVEAQNVEDLSTIQEKISRIQADGGTDILQGLLSANDQFKKITTKRKHIILLTDGHSGHQDDYEALIEEFKNQKITVSTVAIGDGADQGLLEYIANLGKGRHYFSNDPTSIPKIVSKETALASRSYIVDKPQIPKRVTTKDWPVLNQPLPALQTYVATSAKQTAEVNLISLDQDPILARWQYGLGRSVAWTSDLEGKWSSGWVNWPNYTQLWSEIVGWTFPQKEEGNWKVNTQIEGVYGKVTVELPQGAPIPQELNAIIIDKDMNREEISLKPIAPNQLEGKFLVDQIGTYMVQIIETKGDQIIASQTDGLNISYSPEYAIFDGGKEKLEAIINANGGNLITDPEQVYLDEFEAKWTKQTITELLLMIAVTLWPLDIAMRRIQFSSRWIKKWRTKQRNVSKEADLHNEVLSGLISTKKLTSRKSKHQEEKKEFKKENIIEESKKLELNKKETKGIKEVKERKATNENSQDQQSPNDPFKRLIDAKKKRDK